MKKDFMFTSESVTEGHPDKLCDQISDAIVDHFLQKTLFEGDCRMRCFDSHSVYRGPLQLC